METGGTLIEIGIVTENGQRPEVTLLDPPMGLIAQTNRARRNVFAAAMFVMGTGTGYLLTVHGLLGIRPDVPRPSMFELAPLPGPEPAPGGVPSHAPGSGHGIVPDTTPSNAAPQQPSGTAPAGLNHRRED